MIAFDTEVYEPTLTEIKACCREIREHGFVDHRGVRHKPWRLQSKGKRLRTAQPVEFPLVNPVAVFHLDPERDCDE
jgi:hypothetical protein